MIGSGVRMTRLCLTIDLICHRTSLLFERSDLLVKGTRLKKTKTTFIESDNLLNPWVVLY